MNTEDQILDKQLGKLERIAEIIETEHVQPEEFTEVIDAVIDSVNDNNERIDQKFDVVWGNTKTLFGEAKGDIVDVRRAMRGQAEAFDNRINTISLTPGPQGPQGEKGDQGERGADGKDGVNGKDGSPDTGVEIIEKINDVDEDGPQIDAIHIKNLPETTREIIRTTGGGGGNVEVFSGNTKVGSSQRLKFVGATVTNAPDGAIQITTSGSSTPASNITGLTDDQVVFGSSTGGVEQSSSLTYNGTTLATGNLALGTNPASAGVARIPNNSYITARNAANTADVNLVRIGTSDRIQFGTILENVTFSGTTSVGTLNVSGVTSLPAGSASAVALNFGTANTGFYAASGYIYAVYNGVQGFSWDSGAFYTTGAIVIGNGGINNASTVVRSDAANILALRNGTAAQAFRLYNTYTDANNNEFLSIGYTSNVAIINSTKTGTGSVRELRFQYGGTNLLGLGSNGAVWNITAAGMLIASPDNTYDIGASGATRPRHIYAGSSVQTSTGGYGWIGNVGVGYLSPGNLNLVSTGVFGWSLNTGIASAMDVGFSRTSAGNVALGNGTASNTTGSLTLNNLLGTSVFASGINNAASGTHVRLAVSSGAGFVDAYNFTGAAFVNLNLRGLNVLFGSNTGTTYGRLYDTGRWYFGETPADDGVSAVHVGGKTHLKQTAYFDEVDNGNSSTADTIDWGAGNKQKSTLTGNVTFTFTAPPGPASLVLRLIQDATGSRTVTWPAAVKWAGGVAPTLTTTAGRVDVISLYYDGSVYYANSSLNFTP